MDGSTFDRLTQAVSTVGPRRRLLGVLTSVGLGGLLSQLDDESTEAKRKRHGRRRSHRPGKGKDNRKGKRKGKGKGGKGLGGGQCGANGSVCEQDSDCCTTNCFGFECAERVTSCGQGSDATRCQPPAKGCAGDQCCYGSLACGGSCCQAPANQCNPQNECCAPNCTGRSCGPDGCGAGGTCGNCPAGQACNETTGQCQGSTVCNAQTCPDGCCDTASGPVTCVSPPTADHCGIEGIACFACPAVRTCLEMTCDQTGACIPQEVNNQPAPGCDGPGQQCCSAFCRDLQTDPDNCGFCGNVCGENEICANGQCACEHVTCGLDVCCPYGETCSPLNTCPCRDNDDCPNQLQCCGASAGVDGTCTECCDPFQCQSEICAAGECQECISLNGVCSPSVCGLDQENTCCCDTGAGCAPQSEGFSICLKVCSTNDDCPRDYACSGDGFCGYPCAQDSDCAFLGQTCIPSNVGPGTCAQVICTADDQCPAGQTCQGGACVY